MELSRRGLWETGAVVAIMPRAGSGGGPSTAAPVPTGSSATAVYRI